MTPLEESVDQLAASTGFSGVIRVDDGDELVLAKAYGFAHRGYGIRNTVDTRIAIASGSKALTALAVVSLIESGALKLSTTARSVLGDDLPLIADDVTVEHLLSHRSGIGDYLDEDVLVGKNDYVMTLPLHELAETEPFLRMLDGHETKAPAGTTFSYCNGGFVVLAVIAERVSGTTFHDLVHQRVCVPAGMHDTAFLRTDEPEGNTALGYLESDGNRTNIFHLPVRGNGDGGVYTTAADIHTFWAAFFAGRIVSPEWVANMVRSRSDVTWLESPPERYGLGFWLDVSDDRVMLEGSDAGASFRSVHDPASHSTDTVISNVTDAAWPLARLLAEMRRQTS
jgi:CubicO group peptidase (beta-lactamase class C family)